MFLYTTNRLNYVNICLVVICNYSIRNLSCRKMFIMSKWILIELLILRGQVHQLSANPRKLLKLCESTRRVDKAAKAKKKLEREKFLLSEADGCCRSSLSKKQERNQPSLFLFPPSCLPEGTSHIYSIQIFHDHPQAVLFSRSLILPQSLFHPLHLIFPRPARLFD